MRRLLLLGLLGPALAAHALGPHEVLLLVNRRSECSVEVANHYARLRHIPPVNIVHLDVPEGALEESSKVSWEEFQRTIREPAEAELRKRGIADHIIAWVYAPDFPVRITGDPDLSLQGATFVKGVKPEAESVRKGEYRSRVYAGPDRAGGPFAESRSLEYFAASLQQKMPVPSMLLGVAGTRGMSTGQILDHLKAARAADGLQPRAPVWLETNSDVRAQARAWQFAQAKEELQTLGVRAEISAEPPAGVAEWSGLMLGRSVVQPERYGRPAAGALADHLTSYAAVFDTPDQSKLTTWLAHGAAASAGTVTEPLSIWTKFPGARLFAHAARGCTALESYALSVRSPLQLLLVGDPLCAPGAQPIPVALAALSDAPEQVVTGILTFASTPLQPQAAGRTDFLYLLDGRSLHKASGTSGTLDTRTLPDGRHELRVVTYREGSVRHQSFADRGFNVRNHGRSVQLRIAGDAQNVDLDHVLNVEVRPEGEVEEVALIAQERIVARAAARSATTLQLNPRLLGPGPNRLQAVAVYANRMPVRSAPVDVMVKRLNHAPVVKTFTWQAEPDGGGTLAAEGDDAEGDRALALWGERLDHDEAGRDRFEVATDGVRAEWGAEALALQTTAGLAVCRVSGLSLTNAQRWAVRLRVPACPSATCDPAAGLVFNLRDARNYDGFGWFGGPGSWAFVRVVNGEARRVVTRGVPATPGAWVDIAVYRAPAGGLEAEVAGVPLCGWPEGSWGTGGAGLFSGSEAAAFQRIAVCPPTRPGLELTEKGLRMAGTDVPAGLFLRLSDGRAASETSARRPD